DIMVEIVFIEANGEVRKVEAKVDSSVMQTAVENDIPGIIAECRGSCACATCHVYVEQEWLDKLEPPSELEAAMLEFADNAQPNSRLSCQIRITEAISGLTVRTPEE